MSKNILLVDDDAQFRDLVVPELRAKGYVVHEARNGVEASTLERSEQPDLIIVDGLLPDTDGISWISRLRNSGNKTPIIFVSAFWRDVATFNRLTRVLGVSLMVHKPVIPTVFAEQVESQIAAGPERVRVAPELDVQRAMATLRAEYARSLRGKAQELAHAVYQAQKHPDDPFYRHEARGRAHKLRGTAGSYGFLEIGQAAGIIEEGLLEREVRPESWGDIEQALAAVLRAAEELDPTGKEPGLSKMVNARILVVDDDPDFLRVMTEQGRRQLLAILTARSSAEALELARTTPVDAAILNARLPEPEDSFQLARELRALPSCESLPVAFISASGELDYRVAATHAGAAMYLEKALDTDMLAVAMRELVAMRQAGRPRILLVDDDKEFASRVVAILQHAEMVVHHLEDPARILAVLEEVSPDLLLLDVMLPGLSGFDVCRMLRTIPRWRDLPILFLTAKTGVESRVAAFHSGGDDYLVKPIVTEELLARIQVRVDRARLLRERLDKDPLTGLQLRRAFLEDLASRLAESHRHERALSLCLLDLDKLKAINDSHGHPAGDRVLTTLGRLLSRRFRIEDLRGRWGGDEFILAFPGENAETIHGVMDRVHDEFRALIFRGDRGEEFGASFSTGIASFPEDGKTVETLLLAADRRLYAAKAALTG